MYLECDANIGKMLYSIASKKNKTYIGCIASSDKFVVDKETINMLKKFDAIAIDMESASISHTCALNNIPFCSIRAISDTGSDLEFRKFLKEAINKLDDIIMSYFKEIYSGN
ncbi:MAG: hypothetical protein RSE00_02380 [Clostridia bacterium]